MRLRTLIQPFPALLAGLFLSACMSVPMSTYGKLAGLSPLEADPRVIRVAVLVPEDLMMKTGDAVLEVAFTGSDGAKQSGKYLLEISPGNVAPPQLSAELKPGQKAYLLHLNTKDTLALGRLQSELRKAKAAGIHGEGGVTVGFVNACWNGPFPRDRRPMPFDPWIRTEAEGTFYPLFTGFDVKDLLKLAKLDALPACKPGNGTDGL